MIALTSPALPELVTVSCPAGCELGHVVQYAGTEFESYLRCATCGGSGTIEVCGACDEPVRFDDGVEHCGCPERCEICGQLAKLDSANVCQVCFAQGLETIRREEDERAEPIDAEIKWALSVGLCRPEQVEYP